MDWFREQNIFIMWHFVEIWKVLRSDGILQVFIQNKTKQLKCWSVVLSQLTMICFKYFKKLLGYLKWKWKSKYYLWKLSAFVQILWMQIMSFQKIYMCIFFIIGKRITKLYYLSQFADILCNLSQFHCIQ